MPTSGTAADNSDNPMLWEPSQEQIAEANMTAFMAWISERESLDLVDYASFYGWSVDQFGHFARLLGMERHLRRDRARSRSERRSDARGGFPGRADQLRENLLRRRDDSDAIVFRAETR